MSLVFFLALPPGSLLCSTASFTLSYIISIIFKRSPWLYANLYRTRSRSLYASCWMSSGRLFKKSWVEVISTSSLRSNVKLFRKPRLSISLLLLLLFSYIYCCCCYCCLSRYCCCRTSSLISSGRASRNSWSISY